MGECVFSQSSQPAGSQLAWWTVQLNSWGYPWWNSCAAEAGETSQRQLRSARNWKKCEIAEASIAITLRNLIKKPRGTVDESLLGQPIWLEPSQLKEFLRLLSQVFWCLDCIEKGPRLNQGLICFCKTKPKDTIVLSIFVEHRQWNGGNTLLLSETFGKFYIALICDLWKI